jgi:sulfite reductase alpha subunit-like flavoprotein
MIALGTGIAPMRALVQERFAARQNGEKVGPMTLLFGARNQKLDYLYEEEWDHYQKEGILEKALTAFSRDQEKKIYVQHRL